LNNQKAPLSEGEKKCHNLNSMKLKSNEIHPSLKKSDLPSAMLLYGQEQGLIQTQIQWLRQHIIKDEGGLILIWRLFFRGIWMKKDF
jgi:hypothetical protein